MAGQVGGQERHGRVVLTDLVLYILFLVGGALLLVAGLRVFSRSPGVGVVLVSIGGLAGAAPLFWTLLLPLWLSLGLS